jgi:4-amino-4-deoxy-L-arabinose transferase-like glycosyltransferase
MDGNTEVDPQTARRWFDRCALLCIALHMLVWTVVPSLLNRNLPLDVIEALAWGHEWEWGYDKHPPGSAWAAEAAAALGNGIDAPLYFMSQLCIGLGFWGIYRLGKRLFGPAVGLLSVLAMEGILYNNFTSPELNVNVVQFPCWAWAFDSFWLGVHTKRLRWWCLLGVCTGVALLGKYLAVFLALPILAYLIVSPAGRAAWKTPGPYLAVVAALGLFGPHLWWASEHDWVTVLYGMRRAGGGGVRPWTDHLLNPLQFLAAVLFNVSLIWPLLWSLRGVRQPLRLTEDRDRYAWLIACVPVTALLVLSFARGLELKSMWGMPMLVAITLPLAASFRSLPPGLQHWRTAFAVWALLLTAPAIGYVADWSATAALTQHARRCDFDGPALATTITQRWQNTYAQPIPYVIGDVWLAGNIGWYSADRPSVVIWRNGPQSLDIDRAEVLRRGAIVVWSISDRKGRTLPEAQQEVGEIREHYGPLLLQDTITLPGQHGTPDIRVGLAWLPPQGTESYPASAPALRLAERPDADLPSSVQ